MADSLSNLKSEMEEQSKKQDEAVDGLENNSSLKSLGAIVFNSGTLATNVAILRTNTGLVFTLALTALVLNSLAIVISTLQVNYGRPKRIRDLPSEEYGLVAIIFHFVLTLFKFGNENPTSRDSTGTTDDRIDELDHDVIGLKQDLLSLSALVTAEDAKRLMQVYDLLDKVSFYQCNTQGIEHHEQVPGGDATASAENPTETKRLEQAKTGGATTSADNPTSGAVGIQDVKIAPPNTPGAEKKKSRIRKGVSEEDARMRAQLLDTDFIVAIQKAKRVVSGLGELVVEVKGESHSQEEKPYGKMQQQTMTSKDGTESPSGDAHFQAAQTGPWLSRSRHLSMRDTLSHRAKERVSKKGAVCSWACLDLLFQGSIMRLLACCGSLQEDPYPDEDFWLKRKRVLLNIVALDTVRKDLAARLTESSSGWAYPLWVQQLNLLATLIGLIVLVLDIVVATYAGTDPSTYVRGQVAPPPALAQ